MDVHVGAAGRTASRTNVAVGRASTLAMAIFRTQAKAALTGLGWKPAIAQAAVAVAAEAAIAAAAEGVEWTLEQLIRESLRRCPIPKA
jgi:Holliday junction resolvasome RuvABC DNA-binding subunit